MQVLLSWTAVPNALSYNVYRSQTSGSGYQLIFTTLTSNSYTDGPANLTNGVNYYYVVTSVTADGESAFSNQYTATAPVFPTAPSGLTGVVS